MTYNVFGGTLNPTLLHSTLDSSFTLSVELSLNITDTITVITFSSSVSLLLSYLFYFVCNPPTGCNIDKTHYYKYAMIVFKCLHGLAPQYLADDCVLVSAAAGQQCLLSADTMKLLIRRTRTAIDDRDFAVSAFAA